MLQFLGDENFNGEVVRALMHRVPEVDISFFVALPRPLVLDGYDRVLLTIYLAVILGMPLLGYVFMVLDFRRYLRSFRRALVLVAQAVPVTPYWALRSRPVCLKAMGLELPCTEQAVMAAYRELAKELHPDRGGDLDQFLQLQRHFDQALKLVRAKSPAVDDSAV